LPGYNGERIDNPDDIYRIEASRSNSMLYMRKKHSDFDLITFKICVFEKKLDPDHLFRCHKSHIVNMNEVRYYWAVGRQYMTELSKGELIPVSKRRKNRFDALVESKYSHIKKCNCGVFCPVRGKPLHYEINNAYNCLPIKIKVINQY
jgi:DNA-binding LytR/AlgR family response regulator